MKQVFRKGMASVSLAAGMALSAFSGAASAGITWFSPLTGFEDDDLAWVLKAQRDAQGNITGYSAPVQAGKLAVGDRIVGVLEFNQTYPVGNPGAATPVTGFELTGVYDLTIASLTDVPLGTVTGANIFFAPTAAAFSYLSTSPAGSLIQLYTDPAKNLDTVGPNCTDLADCISKASDGSTWAALGFGLDDDEFFSAFIFNNDLTALLASQASASVGTENFGLSILDNDTGKTFGPQACALCSGTDQLIEVVGGGVLKGGQGLQNGAVTRSDVDAQVAPIPEPGTLALVSLSLLGLAFAGRRRT
jgi:hypothetical protein